jgi:hypothetical protein
VTRERAVSSSLRRSFTRTAALGLALGALACEEDFPLGSWNAAQSQAMPSATTTATSTATGSTTTTSPPPPPPPPIACAETGTPGVLNTPGMTIGTTTLSTDWTWPTPVDSLEWDLVMETDPVTDGYYWAHQFSFVNGLTAFFGLQAHGGYIDPNATGPGSQVVDFTKMAVYWIAGPPSDAELGDINQPGMARKAIVTQGNVQWMTIHAKFEWTACDLYHLRVAKESTADSGDVWYGAWILDKTTDVQTFIGRILVPAAWGQISALSTTMTTRIDGAQTAPPVMNCGDPEPASGIFGTPTANDGQVTPLRHTDRFAVPARCGTSRFTDLTNSASGLTSGVRQEIGLHPLSSP